MSNKNSYNLLIVDFRDIFIKYSPYSEIEYHAYRCSKNLKEFIGRNGVHFLIEAAFMYKRTEPNIENALWEAYEDNLKMNPIWDVISEDPYKRYGDDGDDLDWLNVLHYSLVSDADELLKRVVPTEVKSYVDDYIFDAWITFTAGRLCIGSRV